MSARRTIRGATVAEREIQEEWRLNGLRLQLVSRYVLPRLGYRVLKGEEDPWATIKKDPKSFPKLRRLTPYLRDYADYIVVGKQHAVLIVDVKAPAQLRMKGHAGPFARRYMTFSKREWGEYQSSKIPVAVLLWDYNGSKALDEQDEALFYALLDFGSLYPHQELADQIVARIGPQMVRPRTLSPRTFQRFLSKARAMEVVRIEPGRVIRCAALPPSPASVSQKRTPGCR